MDSYCTFASDKSRRHARGYTILETLIGLVVIVITVFAAGITFSDYWATSEKIKKESQSNDISVMIISDIFQSPFSKILAMCTAKSAWSPRTSDCGSVDLKNIPSTQITVAYSATSTTPTYTSLLGKNLGAFGASGRVNPSCIDLVKCEKIISNSIVEMTFNYKYLSSRRNETIEKAITIRRGPW